MGAVATEVGWALGRRAYFGLHELISTESRLWRRLGRDDSLALNMHRVGPRCDRYLSMISVEALRDLLSVIVRCADVITLCQLTQRAAGHSDRPAVVLSFDDGYQDFAEYAVPELSAFGVTANQNVIPYCVNTGKPPWTTALACYLRAAPRRLLASLDVPGLSAVPGVMSVGRERYAGQVRLHLKRLSHTERAPIFQHVVAQLQDVDPVMPAMLSSAELRKLSHLHELGAHSFQHDTMEFETQAYFEQDLRHCQQWFADVLGTPLAVYSFPNDSYQPAQAATLRSQRIIALAGDDPAAPDGVVARRPVGGDSASEVRLRALGLRRRR